MTTRVTSSQMRAALEAAIRMAEPSPPKLRSGEAELLRSHLGAVAALLNVVVVDPDWLAELRRRATMRVQG